MSGHDHHHHGHDHGHAPASFGRAFAIGITINLAYVGLEAGAGLITGSMALLADAGHNLSDVLGLGVAWAGLRLAQRAPSPRFTYGLKRSGILAALFNAVLLFVACGAIAVEAVRRLADPQPVPGGTIMAVAAGGIIVNGITAWLFARGRKGDVNIRGAYLHMLADAGISAAVVVSGFLILKTGLYWIDPALSLIVVAVILRGTWGLLREAVALALDAVPSSIDPAAVADFLKHRPGVTTVHDLHIWPMGSSDTALTAHLVMPAGHPGDAALAGLAHDLEHRFGIGHATIQVETGAADCAAVACA
ncbi:MAG: cation diffusion facilitator family transporter [Polymorphobacter sp.]